MQYSLKEANWTLNQIKKVSGMNQSAIARELGVRPQTLTAFKRGRTVSAPIFKGLQKLLNSFRRYAVQFYEQYNGIMGYIFEIYSLEHLDKIQEDFRLSGASLIYSKIYKRITSPVVRKHDKIIKILEQEMDMIFLNRVDFLSNMVDKIKSVKIKQALGEELGLIYD